jgi:hypothetical protein
LPWIGLTRDVTVRHLSERGICVGDDSPVRGERGVECRTELAKSTYRELKRDSLRGIHPGPGWNMYGSIHASMGRFRRRLGKSLESGQPTKRHIRRRATSLYAPSCRIRSQRFGILLPRVTFFENGTQGFTGSLRVRSGLVYCLSKCPIGLDKLDAVAPSTLLSRHDPTSHVTALVLRRS